MDRIDCNMCHCLGDKIYCSYYDVFYMLCDNVKDCSEGLDDEWDEDDEYDDYEEKNETP